MKRALIVTLIVLAGSAACMAPWAKGGPKESFIVFTSDTIGELKPCG